MSQDSYDIKLPQFEGPFDLLLFFIERDELDIYDIPISKVTEDFLSYMHQMDILNIELASEFILVASTLMRIKAKMLLPRKELDEAGNEIDPREELVSRLLEYKRYKEVTSALRDMEEKRAKLTKRGYTGKEMKGIAEMYSAESELHSLTLFKLLKSFQKVMERFEYEQNKPVHQVVQYPFTIRSQKDIIMRVCASGNKQPFEKIFETVKTRMEAIFTFLAALELIQEKILKLQTGSGVNNFWVQKVMN